MVIEYGYIRFYHETPTAGDFSQKTPFLSLIMRNLRFPCTSA